ncbi:hypothetical protein FZEAL_4674 [Fusarium zealandicum]|uniref:Uncharacterized protein n=1 Tax=Fusarium zealandicum TaxID=1053134 RepID=A0A8H4XLB9_9HYPO|nr:hypothetical protein FZEAL_4674 [Fusarium zealandicum]
MAQLPTDEGPYVVSRPSTGKLWSRLSLRLLSIIFCIAAICFSAFYYSKWTIGALIMMGPPTVFAILWDSIDAICLCVRRGRYGVHPNACLIVDMLLFLGLGAMSGVIAFMISKLDDSGWYFAFFQDKAGKEYLHIVLGFGIIAAITHLAIFIVACFEIKGHRSPAPRIIYVSVNHVGPINQHPQVGAASTETPPAYSLSPQQSPQHHLQDQMPVFELGAMGSTRAGRKL